MDNATRLQYLEAMGIDVWVPRHQPVTGVPAGGESDNVGRTVECRDGGGIPSRAQGTIAEQRDADQEGLNQSTVTPSEAPECWASLASAQATQLSHAGDHAWSELQQQVAACHACQLCETRTQTVFGVGSHRASWMLIGEAPGQNEDLQGEPFVGKAGQLLNEMLRAIGLAREEVFIANVLKCRPPANRDPQAEEVAACHDFLQQQISLLQPKIILAVGRIAAQNLLNSQQPLAKLRGRLHRLEDIPLVVVHHPAYLLRALTEKAKAWDDLQFALSVYQSLEEK
ncbi:uracil-DNA glycosylase [Methylomonas lenta]|uniref:Type-4 uracil-DNA glycosylase n=1 Tax=Methylomonas lenta TaxID=980561 RepID=A0A177NLC0_9GAMM|nr:uracil-DNA glycosylase [Methylomonas lenta]OAI18642.1 uracil-DNA glycosylase [Methylomonas lenta]